MNKHQRKRSRQIKRWMRILNCYGYNVTYKQTRRRRLDREFNNWLQVWRYGTAPVCREVRGILSGINPKQNGYSPTVFIIDETPIEDTPKLWPKDNPFMVKYLGRWHYKKEEK